MKQLLALSLIVFISACAYENEEEFFPPPSQDEFILPPGPMGPGQMVSYMRDIKPIISRACTPNCHNGGSFGPGNFNNYTDLKLRIDNGKFDERVLDPSTRTMPRGNVDGISPMERALMRSWIADGAKNN